MEQLDRLEDFVRHVYKQLFDRLPSEEDISADVSYLKQLPSNLTRQQQNYYYEKCTDQQHEYLNKVVDRNGAFNQLNFIYNTLLRRDVDPAGERAYLEKIERGLVGRVCKAIIFDRHGEFCDKMPAVREKAFCCHIRGAHKGYYTEYIRGEGPRHGQWHRVDTHEDIPKRMTQYAVFKRQAQFLCEQELRKEYDDARGFEDTGWLELEGIRVVDGACPN